MNKKVKPYKARYSDDEILTFPVKVVKTRRAYGREELLIKPVKGSGEKWVTENKVKK